MATVEQLSKLAFTPNQAKHLGYNTQLGISASGITQVSGFKITANVNGVLTATGGVDNAVTLPSVNACALGSIYIFNISGATIQVFPAIGEGIYGFGTNNPINVVNNGQVTLYKDNDALIWIGAPFT